MARQHRRSEVDVALTRFGLGPRPAERELVAADPVAWLDEQLRGRRLPASLRGLPSSAEHVRTRLEERKGLGRDQDAQAAVRRAEREHYQQEAGAHILEAVRSAQPFRERLVAFWANHFTVSVANDRVRPLACSFEREAIRPHLDGTLAEMLGAVARHPAMLVYLDNVRSVGPSSQAGARRDRGLNENLAREILELHTLGVDGGYSQDDVQALAAALTGWSVSRVPEDVERYGPFAFRDQAHERGAKTLLGTRYVQGGEAQAQAMLDDLARHPATALHVAHKFAKHFVADTPPEGLVDDLAAAFLAADGHLPALARALVDDPRAWKPAAQKLTTPWEHVVAIGRALELESAEERLSRRNMGPVGERLVYFLTGLGQAPYAAPSPQGWPDEAEAWSGPEALLQRIGLAREVSRRFGELAPDPVAFADEVYGSMLPKATRAAMVGADGRSTALGLLFASPHLMRR